MMNYLRIPAQSIFTAFYFIGSVALFNINPGNTQDLKTSKTQEYIENLKSKNNKVRENAATSLIRIGGLAIPSLEGVDDNAMAYILPRILKESSLCKKICNTRIGEINDKEKILSLINSDLNSHKKDLRLIALVFLAEYSVHDKEFISAFIPIFRNELDEEVRDISEKLVAGVGDSAIPQLMIAMKDEDERIHNSAVQSFVNMGERATDSLLKVFDDKNERIRIGAVDALGQITQLNINQSLKFYQKNSSSLSLKVPMIYMPARYSAKGSRVNFN